MSANISEDKMLSHLYRVAGDYRPITADVFLTNYCNNKCPYCIYRRWDMDSGASAMRYEDFVRYATRLTDLGVEGIILTGGGEPTLCPEFSEICWWMEDRGIHYGINTNFNQLKLFKPDYLKISLDGWDEKSYEKSRGVQAYAQTVENIKAYCDWKKTNSPKTTVGVQIVCMDVSDVYLFYQANKGLDVDYFSFRPVESTGGTYYKSSTSQRLAERITAAVEYLAKDDDRVVLNFKWGMLGKAEKDCTAQWAQIALNEKGEVIYCCHKPYQIVGHIMDADILEKKAAAVTDMSMCDIPCRMTAPNAFVSQTQRKRQDACFI